MKSLKNTKTFENLMKAFSGESQARNRYTYFASAKDISLSLTGPFEVRRLPTLDELEYNGSKAFEIGFNFLNPKSLAQTCFIKSV